MKLAIVHDYLNQMGGAERVLMVLHEIFPDAPIYTSIYAPDLVDPAFRRMDVRTSFMQRLPFVHQRHQPFLPLFPLAFESLDLRGYDVVLSMSSGWAKNVLTRPETCHVCYCLTPMRFGWSFDDYVVGERVAPWQRRLLAPVLAGLRVWDVAGANRVDHFAAISTGVARRIMKYYRREAEVIYPPVHTEPSTGHDADDGGYFLVVSRLVPYKRVDLAIEACNRLEAPLKIIGAGRDRARLQALAGPTIEFLGRVDDGAKRRHLLACRAFVFPAEEDFGIAPVEAMAAGRPVVAYAAGGALDTIVHGTTGVLFSQPTVQSLAAALEVARQRDWDRAAIRAHATRFDVRTFRARLKAFVEQKAAAHRAALAALPAGLQ
jgi:glycosyltransferase involved in cell wall biosynthesis